MALSFHIFRPACSRGLSLDTSVEIYLLFVLFEVNVIILWDRAANVSALLDMLGPNDGGLPALMVNSNDWRLNSTFIRDCA